MMTVAIPAPPLANVLPFVPAMPEPEPIKSQPAPIVARALGQMEVDRINGFIDAGRGVVIAEIKNALQRRSGKSWSVTGGKGTAYGWLTIDAPPARRTWKHVPREGCGECPPPGNEFWEYVDSGEQGYNISPADAAELAQLLGLETIHNQGHDIPASHDYYRVALARARHGHAGQFKAEAYWD